MSLFAYLSAPFFVIGETLSGTMKHRIPSDNGSRGTFSFDMEFFGFITSEEKISIYNVKTGAQTHSLNAREECYGTSDKREGILFSRDSRLVARDCPDCVTIWNLELPHDEPLIIENPFKLDGKLEDVAFSHDSTLVAATWRARPDNLPSHFPQKYLIFIWNTDTGAPTQTIAILDPGIIGHRYRNLSFDPNNRWLITGLCCIAVPNSDPCLLDNDVRRSILSKVEYLGFWFNSITDFSWIEFKGKRALYVPPDFRPFYLKTGEDGEKLVHSVDITRSASTSLIATTTIAVRSRTNKTWMTKLSETEFEKETMSGVNSSDAMKINQICSGT